MEKQLLKDAALCAINFIEVYSGTGAKTKRYQALKGLAELTLADLENGKEESECTYTAYDVLDKIQGTKYSAEESKKPRANQYLKDLTKHLPCIEKQLIAFNILITWKAGMMGTCFSCPRGRIC